MESQLKHKTFKKCPPQRRKADSLVYFSVGGFQCSEKSIKPLDCSGLESIAIPRTGIPLPCIFMEVRPSIAIPNEDSEFPCSGEEGGLAACNGDGGVFLGSDMEITSFRA